MATRVGRFGPSAEAIDSSVHWAKHLSALCLGLGFGLTRTTGSLCIIAFLISAGVATYITYSQVLRVDSAALGQEGQAELFKEGLMPALALCAAALP
jgi:hypothetical protein